jgi:hypothetical protein
MYFLMLKDKRATNAPENMRTIICKHADKQTLVDFYSSMIDGANFQAGSLLEPFHVPANAEDEGLLVAWDEAYFVEHATKSAEAGIAHFTEELKNAEQVGKQKWADISNESFSPTDLLAHFAKIKHDEAVAQAAAASGLDFVGDVPEIDPLLAAQAEPLPPEAQM